MGSLICPLALASYAHFSWANRHRCKASWARGNLSPPPKLVTCRDAHEPQMLDARGRKRDAFPVGAPGLTVYHFVDPL